MRESQRGACIFGRHSKGQPTPFYESIAAARDKSSTSLSFWPSIESNHSYPLASLRCATLQQPYLRTIHPFDRGPTSTHPTSVRPTGQFLSPSAFSNCYTARPFPSLIALRTIRLPLGALALGLVLIRFDWDWHRVKTTRLRIPILSSRNLPTDDEPR